MKVSNSEYSGFFLIILLFVTITSSQELIEINNEFTLKLHNEISKNASNNFIVSPFSAQTILALTTLGTKGETQNELIKSLSLPSKNSFKEIFGQFLNENMKTERRLSTLTSANKIYLEQGFGIVPEFLNDANVFFGAKVENVNFGNADDTVSKINTWVSNRTNGKINEIITKDKINELTRVVLINTLYFKANWAYPFNVKDTKKLQFHNTKHEDGIVQVDTMEVTAYLRHCRNEEFKFTFVKLPYRAIPVEMVLVIPDEIDGIESLDIEKVLKDENNNCTIGMVKLLLPKFKVETETNLIPILQNLGINKLFNRDADLSGISIKEGLYVSNVLQKVFIEIDEVGTEAAAATAVISNARSALGRRKQEPIEIKFDHPFLFLLKLKDVVLFSGSILKLEKK